MSADVSSGILIKERRRGASSMSEAGKADLVVLAVDASNEAEDAFDWYVDHLHRPGNKLVLVHGTEAPAMPTRDSWETQTQLANSRKGELQTKYEKKAADVQIEADFVFDMEKPGDLIVRVADSKKANYVVMGTRGLGKIRRTIMGSVSDYVVHHSHCPVVVCRNSK